MVSELFAFIAGIVHMNFSGQILIAILALIAGSFTYRLMRGLRSSVWLTVIGLVLVLFTVNAIQTREILWSVILTTCLSVVGYEGYRRLVWR
jgi:hypothetical protein